jgi:hypothetical protein
MAFNYSQRRRCRRLVLSAIGLLAALTAAVGCNRAGPSPTPVTGKGPATGGQPVAAALDGKLDVVVRRLQRASEPLLVEEAGALPVRSGEIMSLLVQLKEPAYVYLVWLDSHGQALPLYPWNTETLEATDISLPPPTRQAARVVYSPLLGGGWTFGKRGGIETILLLARPTPLDGATNLESLIAPLPATRMQSRDELVMLRLDRSAKTVETVLARNPGREEDAMEADRQLRELLVRLGEHFDVVQAVRFAHEGE